MMFQLLILVSALSIPIECYWDEERPDRVRRFSRYYTHKVVKGCAFRGYYPEMRVKDIGNVKVPQAVLGQQTAMDVIMSLFGKDLGKAGKGAGVAMHSLNEVNAVLGKAITKILPIWSKLAPKFAPVLGIFSACISATAPTAGDILEATNMAIADLGKEIDRKMDRMRGYVETKITDLERVLIQRDVKVMMRLLTACIQEIEEFRDECIRESYATLSSWQPKFAIFQEGILKKRKLEYFQAKEVETYLPSFQVYANFVLLTAKTLVNAYEYDNTKTDTEIGEDYNTTKEEYNATLRGRQYYRYKKQLDEQLTFFRDYVNKSINVIAHTHWKNDGLISCNRTFSCDHIGDVKGDYFPKSLYKQADKYKCKCTFDDSTKELCEMDFTVYLEGSYGSHGSDSVKTLCKPSDTTCVLRDIAGLKPWWIKGTLGPLGTKAISYRRQMVKSIYKYWLKNLIPYLTGKDKEEYYLNQTLERVLEKESEAESPKK